MKGLFVTFEGIDGCGKSTQLKLAAEALVCDGVECAVSREPGGTGIAEKIRALILSPDHEEMADACEVLLYLASRAQHVREKIVPELEKGRVVLCDRFELATFAYQGHGRGTDMDILAKMNGFATGGLTPALSFVFDVPVEVAFERIRRSGKATDRLERNPRDFHERVREGYLRAASADPHRIVLLQGDLPVEALARMVYERLRGLREKTAG
jgi:dTMP kinase